MSRAELSKRSLTSGPDHVGSHRRPGRGHQGSWSWSRAREHSRWRQPLSCPWDRRRVLCCHRSCYRRRWPGRGLRVLPCYAGWRCDGHGCCSWPLRLDGYSHRPVLIDALHCIRHFVCDTLTNHMVGGNPWSKNKESVGFYTHRKTCVLFNLVDYVTKTCVLCSSFVRRRKRRQSTCYLSFKNN
jgi:hypothetical protein